MRPSWIALVVAVASLGGCLGGGGDGDDGDGNGEGTPDAEDARGAGPGPAPPSGAGSPAEAPARPEAVPVSWDGGIPPRACLPTGPGSCAGPSVPPVTGRPGHLLLPGPPADWSGTLTMTWQAQAPTTAALSLWFQFYESCGDGCTASTGEWVVARGTSPLVLDLDGVAAPAGSQGAWISVDAESLAPDPLYAEAHAGQDVHVEGLLLKSRIRSS